MGERPGTRYVQQRDDSYDWMVREDVTLWGLEDEAHADATRLGLRRAARHLGVAVKPLWHPCGGCDGGGPDPHYDLVFSVYTLADARRYMQDKAERLGWPQRQARAS
jgi:hypothetical protein